MALCSTHYRCGNWGSEAEQPLQVHRLSKQWNWGLSAGLLWFQRPCSPHSCCPVSRSLGIQFCHVFRIRVQHLSLIAKTVTWVQPYWLPELGKSLKFRCASYCRKNGHGMENTRGSKGKHPTVFVISEPAQNGPHLFNKILSSLSETTDQKHKSCSWVCTEERTLTSSCIWNQSPAPTVQLKDEDITGSWKLDPFQKQKVHCPGRPCVDAPHQKQPSSKVFQLKLALPALPHTYSS